MLFQKGKWIEDYYEDYYEGTLKLATQVFKNKMSKLYPCLTQLKIGTLSVFRWF